MLLNSGLWWLQYLRRRMKSAHSVTLARPHYICWTDASGAGRLIAAVVTGPRGTFFARAYVPDWFWNQ